MTLLVSSVVFFAGSQLDALCRGHGFNRLEETIAIAVGDTDGGHGLEFVLGHVVEHAVN